jgi:hypothetical protein
MNRICLIIGLIIIPTIPGFCQINPKLYKQSKTIKLDSFENKPIFAYENSMAIIYLDKSMVIERVRKHLENKRLCNLRKINYNKILNHLSASDSSFFVIEPTMTPDLLLKYGGITKTDTMTGYVPLDYYAKVLKKDISTNYLPPYGYKIELDTLGKVHLDKYFIWMISDLALKGKAKIYNKQTKNYEKKIIFEVISFEGHGGENLLFQDKQYFFDIATYSDAIMPDFECGDDYNGYKIIE